MMEKIVLVGSSIAHSRSPLLHNHLFQVYNLPYHYELLPLDAGEVQSTLAQMKHGSYRGANITSPHKERVMASLNRTTPGVDRIGAANTIVFEEGSAIGYNTDVYGVREALQGHGIISAPFTAAVLGTGGAASAAVYALLAEPMLRKLVIYSRSSERAMHAAEKWNDPRVKGHSLDGFSPADLVIHATPVGLSGNTGALLEEVQLRGVRVLFEMIYSPAETELVRRARRAGADIIPGMSMFLFQALRSFKLWTGVTATLNDIPPELFDQHLSA